MESFRQGLALGADGIEFDVRVSRDGVPVVIHDATLERTTDGAGRVDAHPVGALRALDAGYRFTPDGGRTFPYRGQGIRIPLLDEVLEAFPQTPCIIELKTRAATEALASAIDRLSSNNSSHSRQRYSYSGIGRSVDASRGWWWPGRCGRG